MRALRRLLLLIAFLIAQAYCATIVEEYEACKNGDKFGTDTFVCDREQRLSERTVAKLAHLLGDLKDKIPCTCEDGCERPDGRKDYIGLLLVTESNNTKSLAQDSRKIFYDAQLGTPQCDHGLLMVYLQDTAQLATYRGDDTFVLLTDEDMEKLHELAQKGTEGGDAVALQYLLQNYKEAIDPRVQRAESWMPVVGLLAATLIVLVILAVLLALFLARFCCCCQKNKKEVYHVNTIPTYKSIEPLYVVTPPAGPNDRFPHPHHSEGIYSTPYSGSPLPYAHPPPPGTSRPITPASTYRNRIHPAGGETPLSQKRTGRGEYAEKKTDTPTTMKSSRGEYAEKKSDKSPSVGGESLYAVPPSELYSNSTLPAHNGYLPSPYEAYGTIPRPTVLPRDGTLRQSVLTESDLSFLDPMRRQETQTREDFIY